MRVVEKSSQRALLSANEIRSRPLEASALLSFSIVSNSMPVAKLDQLFLRKRENPAWSNNLKQAHS